MYAGPQSQRMWWQPAVQCWAPGCLQSSRTSGHSRHESTSELARCSRIRVENVCRTAITKNVVATSCTVLGARLPTKLSDIGALTAREHVRARQMFQNPGRECMQDRNHKECGGNQLYSAGRQVAYKALGHRGTQGTRARQSSPDVPESG